MGTFGFFRYAIPLFPEAALHFRPAIATLAVVGIVYGALMCLVQKDMKRLVAYSSVSHLGFVMLGMMALTAEGLTGSVYQMLNHGVSTGGLFLLVGLLYERRHTRLIADYGGIARQVPWIAAAFVVVTLSSVGLPGTNGFVGEFLILSGTWLGRLPRAGLYAALGATGVILGAVYMLLLVERVFFGPMRHEANRGMRDRPPRGVLRPRHHHRGQGWCGPSWRRPSRRWLLAARAGRAAHGRGPQVGTEPPRWRRPADYGPPHPPTLRRQALCQRFTSR
jgi:NADH-quinone oxidoreductase subunit M